MKRFKLIPILLLAALYGEGANAAIVINAPTASSAGNITFQQDLTFTITTNTSGFVNLVFDEWITSGDGATNSMFYPGIQYSVNVGPTLTFTFSDIYDNGPMLGGITPKDGLLMVTNQALFANDQFTIKAGSYAIPQVAGFNPQTNQIFSGNLFLVASGSSYNRISNIIPEPSASTLLMTCALAASLCRRRER